MTGLERYPWESDPDLILAESNLLACAYNATVNHGSERGARKMGDLVRAINLHERTRGAVRLQYLADAEVIAGFTPCPDECEVRPGGLFHAAGCENDANHPTYRARTAAADRSLPSRLASAARVSLVGRIRSVQATTVITDGTQRIITTQTRKGSS